MLTALTFKYLYYICLFSFLRDSSFIRICLKIYDNGKLSLVVNFFDNIIGISTGPAENLLGYLFKYCSIVTTSKIILLGIAIFAVLNIALGLYISSCVSLTPTSI